MRCTLSKLLFEAAKLILFTYSIGFYTPHWNDGTSNRGRPQGLAVISLVCIKIEIQRCHTRSWRVLTKLETEKKQYFIRRRDVILLAEFLCVFSPLLYVINLTDDLKLSSRKKWKFKFLDPHTPRKKQYPWCKSVMKIQLQITK